MTKDDLISGVAHMIDGAAFDDGFVVNQMKRQDAASAMAAEIVDYVLTFGEPVASIDPATKLTDLDAVSAYLQAALVNGPEAYAQATETVNRSPWFQATQKVN